MIYVLCIYYSGNGAPCTQRGLHFLYILDWDLKILSLQHFFFVFNKCGNDILMLQHARKNRLSDLHSSMKVGTNLRLCLQSKIGIFKSFGNTPPSLLPPTAGSPINHKRSFMIMNSIFVCHISCR